MTVGRSDWTLKFTEGSWQGSFTVNNERAIRTLKPSSEQKNVLREFLQGQNLLVNLPTNFPASSNRCRQMHCRVFCNLADSSNVKTNQEIMIFTAKKKELHTCSYSGPGNFGEALYRRFRASAIQAKFITGENICFFFFLQQITGIFFALLGAEE